MKGRVVINKLNNKKTPPAPVFKNMCFEVFFVPSPKNRRLVQTMKKKTEGKFCIVITQPTMGEGVQANIDIIIILSGGVSQLKCVRFRRLLGLKSSRNGSIVADLTG